MKEGPSIPRMYGSYKSKICIDCGCWHKYDWHDNPVDDWESKPIEDEIVEEEV